MDSGIGTLLRDLVRAGSVLSCALFSVSCAQDTTLDITEDEVEAPEVELAASASCVGFPELDTWLDPSGEGPYRIKVFTGEDCKLRATVWEKQSSGNLWLRGTFFANPVVSNGVRWILIDQIPVGGYIEHLWLHALGDGRLRVWIFYESVDIKPDASEDLIYVREKPDSGPVLVPVPSNGPSPFGAKAKPGVDFDGDGKTDVFSIQQRPDGLYQWYYSSGGAANYKPLNYAKQPIEDLRFGDFDGDGKTDVFAVDKRSDGLYQWYYSSGGTANYKPLAYAKQPIEELRFGDFDDDGKTDVFAVDERSDGLYQWYYSSGGAANYKPLAYAKQPIEDLRFGDFDADGKIDVFAVDERSDGLYQWYYSSGGVANYKPLAYAKQPIEDLRFGDFDGDGKTDVFAVDERSDDLYQWYYSSGGVANYKPLAYAKQPIEDLRFGDFDADGKTDVFAVEPRSDGSYQWYYSAGGVANYKAIARGQSVDELRVGE